VDLWTVGCADSRLTAQARFPMDNPWKTLRVSHRLPTGRRLPTSSTARQQSRLKSGKVKTITRPPSLAYSTPVAVQTTGTTAELLWKVAKVCLYKRNAHSCSGYIFSSLRQRRLGQIRPEDPTTDRQRHVLGAERLLSSILRNGRRWPTVRAGDGPHRSSGISTAGFWW